EQRVRERRRVGRREHLGGVPEAPLLLDVDGLDEGELDQQRAAEERSGVAGGGQAAGLVVHQQQREVLRDERVHGGNLLPGRARGAASATLTRIDPMSRVLSAVAWPYANGPRHIGHVAGFGVPSDVFSRYMRMAGHDVLMVSGSDEHGTPILIAADEAGLTPQELADRNHRLIIEDFVTLGLAYDLYTRTTTRNHHAVVQELFRGVHANGYVVEQTTMGAISPSTGRTLPDRYIEGTCPICGYDGARGDQCDSCGNQLDPQDLIDPRSKINGETPEFVQTQHFLLDLPALAEALGQWLDEREATGLWRPNVIRFSQNILAEIRPRAITRDIDWGIAIPLDGWRENPNKKLYVW